MRRRLKGDRGAGRLIGRLYRKYPTGFIVNVTSHYLNGRQAAAYCCRYTGRPPLSERRLGYDGKRVTLTYRDYRDGQEKSRTLSAVGYIPLENIVGRAGLIFFSRSFDAASPKVRSGRIGTLVH